MYLTRRHNKQFGNYSGLNLYPSSCTLNDTKQQQLKRILEYRFIKRSTRVHGFS